MFEKISSHLDRSFLAFLGNNAAQPIVVMTGMKSLLIMAMSLILQPTGSETIFAGPEDCSNRPQGIADAFCLTNYYSPGGGGGQIHYGVFALRTGL